MINHTQEPAERYFGVEFADDGELVVAERQDGCRAGTARYPSGPAGVAALCEHMRRQASRPHVCIRACGGAALAVAIGLMSVPNVEVTMMAPRSIDSRRPVEAVAAGPEADAERLAQRAEKLF